MEKTFIKFQGDDAVFLGDQPIAANREVNVLVEQ